MNWAALGYRFPSRYRMAWLALALLSLVALVSASSVFKSASLHLVTALAGVLLIASLGQLLVVMLGGIDLSVPSVMTLAAAIVVRESGGADDKLVIAVLEALAAGLAVGLINGFLVAVARLNALIVTLAMGGIVGGLTLWWTGGTFSSSGLVPPGLHDAATSDVWVFSSIAIAAFAIAAALQFVLKRTRQGRAFVAVGASRQAARIVGIRVTVHEIAGYAVAGALYAVAGLLLAGYVKTPNTTVGDPYLLTTIVVVALGGAALGGGPGSAIATIAGAGFVVLLEQYFAIRSISGGVLVLAQGLVLIGAVSFLTLTSQGRLLVLLRGVWPARWRRQAVS